MEASRPGGLGLVPCSRTKVRASSPHSLLGAGGREQTVADGQSLERPVTAGPGGGVLAMLESQRLRSLLQAGRSFPALSSILAPPSVEWVPSMLLSSGGLEGQGQGARSLKTLCIAPLSPRAQSTVARSPLR